MDMAAARREGSRRGAAPLPMSAPTMHRLPPYHRDRLQHERDKFMSGRLKRAPSKAAATASSSDAVDSKPSQEQPDTNSRMSSPSPPPSPNMDEDTDTATATATPEDAPVVAASGGQLDDTLELLDREQPESP